MRKAKLDRPKSNYEYSKVEKRIKDITKSNLELVDNFDLFAYILTVTNDLIYNYARLTDIAYVKELENVFLETYKKMCTLLDKTESKLEKNISKFLSNGAKSIYLRNLKFLLKDSKIINIPLENLEGVELNDLAFYYNVKANIKLCDDIIKLIPDKEDVVKYYKHVRINLYSAIKVIRDEYNSGVREGGVKLI